MNAAYLTAFILLGVGVLFTLGAVATGQPVPCGLPDPCPTPTPSPAPAPAPTPDDPWATNLWYWAIGAIITAVVAFIVGLLKSVRQYLQERLAQDLERRGRQ